MKKQKARGKEPRSKNVLVSSSPRAVVFAPAADLFTFAPPVVIVHPTLFLFFLVFCFFCCFFFFFFLVLAQDVDIPEETMTLLCEQYTQEPGVRRLEQLLSSLCRAAVVQLMNIDLPQVI